LDDNLDQFEEFIQQLEQEEEAHMDENETENGVSCRTLHPKLVEFMDTLADPITCQFWKDQMTPLEAQLCLCLSTDLSVNYVLRNFPELEGREPENILEMLMTVIGLTVLANKNLASQFGDKANGR
jgi:hypothetical protein